MTSDENDTGYTSSSSTGSEASDYSSSSMSSESSSDAYMPPTSIDPELFLQQLEQGIRGKIHVNVELSRFVHEVWGIDEDTVQKLLAMPVMLDEVELARYKKCTKKDNLHAPFRAISNQLLKKAFDEVQGPHTGSSSANDTIFWGRLQPKAEPRGDLCLPDIALDPLKPLPVDGSAPQLSVVKHVLVLEHHPHGSDKLREGQNEIGNSGIGGLDNGAADNSDSASTGHDSTNDESINPANVLKRPLSPTEDDCMSRSDRASKKPRLEGDHPLRNSSLPLVIAQMLGASSRHYAIGVLVDRFDVTVCYFDRFTVACVSPFSFEEEPSKLALVLYAMKQCDRVHAGFNPHLLDRADSGGSDVAGVIGSCFEYPADGSVNEITAPSETLCLQIAEVLQRPAEIIGPAMSVYKVQKRLPDGTFSEDEYLHKLNWPSKTSVSEIDVVKRLKERLPKEAYDHIPEFIYTSTSTPSDLNLPWLRLGLDLSKQERRDAVLRVATGKLYHNLWEAGSIENFKQVWLDCVECLYLAYRQGKVLHSPLGDDDLMVLKLPDGSVKGVLNGWDTSMFIKENGGEDSLLSTVPCARTRPFLPWELLYRREPKQLYLRHHLESFFWILIWAALHYSLKASKRDRHVHSLVEGWVEDSKSYSGGASKSLILDFMPLGVDKIYKSVKCEFTGLVKEWIEPLRALLTEAKYMHYRKKYEKEAFDEETLGGTLTFETFMKAINVTPRTWGIPGYLNGDSSH